MKIIEKTVVDKYAPRDTNVDWLDISGDKPVKKSYINGKWQVIGGSGAGSSNPTEADATKVWQVTPVLKDTKTEEVVIAPMQTMNINREDPNSTILQNVSNLDKFVEGAEATIIFDGVEYNEIIEANIPGGSTYGIVIESVNFGILKYPPEVTGFPEDILSLLCNEGEHTISVNIISETPTYDYNWAPGVKIPIPTAKDEGKILAVNKVEVDSKEYELAPTQTVRPSRDGTILQNTSNLDKFVEGATVISVLNGTSYTEQVINDDDLLHVTINENCSLNLVDNEGEVVLIFAGDHHSYEIYASILENEYSYEYQLQENSSSGSSEKVITLNNWSPNGNNSYLIDVDGNRFEEGTDYTILYLSNNPSQYVFGTSGSIKEIRITNTLANIICDKIIVNDLFNRKWTKIPDFIRTNNGGKVCWLYIDNNNISHECSIYIYIPSPLS